MNWLKRILGLHAVQGECIPRAFFNATAWAIAKRCPVYIADFAGHWQAVGEQDGELHFLEGDGWNVWVAGKEGTKPMVTLWNLRDAMEHFIEHNPWCMPSENEQKALDERLSLSVAQGVD